MVFVAFSKHGIQSNVTHLMHVERVESVLCIYVTGPPGALPFDVKLGIVQEKSL